ncbi:hypothetical protein FQZ97_697600 [compost metagenome]
MRRPSSDTPTVRNGLPISRMTGNIAANSQSSPLGCPFSIRVTPSMSVSRSMPALASIGVLTFIRCMLACMTTTGRRGDTASRSRTSILRPSKKIGSKPQPISVASGAKSRSASLNLAATASRRFKPSQSRPSGPRRS